ncbi:pseudouridine synthase [Pseudomonas seleniipraecipitans]|uniref:Pseudouridine synthase n=1 Tax=Phytopseudomonas seleniipraecipitans TaxID=640205 RepID=A0ABY5JFD4_9GAMM|nr:pseudouridine synthase [Pseudomonas seleniipraecipitans]UUD65140.1 pseudouridine synthase [Pseudomonas seleniipraecipitans]
MRIDRLLSNLPRFNRQHVRLLLAEGRVRVDGLACRDSRFEVRAFHRVEVDDELVQAGKPARYFMLHKPVGVVSATSHPEHRTVLDLLDEPDKHELHLAGRLDLNTSGLLLITNDGLWSRRATAPDGSHAKVYRVETEQVIDPAAVEVFAQGLYFAYEDLTTRPALLEIQAPHHAKLTLHEGRYHQIKRMFGHFQNKVIGLHRQSLGAIVLDPDLPPGAYRPLTQAEIASV